MAYSVNISVEAPIENQIQEITYDGQEIYQAPLSMSENLARLAQKIDFTKTEDDYLGPVIKKEGESSSDPKSTDDDPKDPNFQSSLWPWDSVRNKLRNALTEVCVLADVLAIAKEKRYMVLDPVPQEPTESRTMVQVYGRKKALAAAASTLLAGMERLRANENIRNARNTPDFHIDLLRLRQNWRLKKVSNAIIGDLSYRTAGSKFNQTGIFEVTKAPEDPLLPLMGLGPNAPPQGPPPSALRVTVPPELQGVAFISVMCQKEVVNMPYPINNCTEDLWHSNRRQVTRCRHGTHTPNDGMCDRRQDFGIFRMEHDQEELFSTTIGTGTLMGAGMAAGTGPGGERDLHWQPKLEAAQNVLFCKELFSRLASEAVQLDSSIPHMVVGNQIVATVLPGIQLLIGLCHSNGQNNPGNPDNPKEANPPPAQKSDHDHVLEHSLHQLLRQVHYNNTHHPFPHPASGPLGPSKRRCLAGPMASDRYELLEMSKQQTLLEQIIQQAQHFFMRRRTEYVLDTIAKEVKDPLIISHWNALNSPTQSCVKINITTHGYDAVCRTSLVVHVGEKTLKCICRDGRVMHMSYELQELRDLIYCQIYQHQMLAVQSVSRCMGWQILAGSAHMGSGPVEPLGNASSCLLASPTGDRMIAVRCEPSSQIQVSIAQSPKIDFFANQLVKERKWEHLTGPFKDVRFEKMEGKNFLNKLELLMACLSNST